MLEKPRLREVEPEVLQLGFESPLDQEPALFSSARSILLRVSSQNQETWAGRCWALTSPAQGHLC